MSDPFDHSTWTDQDRFYFGYVDEMLADGVDAPISNVEPTHATCLVRTLLQNAKHQVRLFTGRLPSEGEKAIYIAPAIAEAAKELLWVSLSTLLWYIQDEVLVRS